MTTDLTLYTDLLGDIKARIWQAQVKATLSANAEMILMYWDRPYRPVPVSTNRNIASYAAGIHLLHIVLLIDSMIYMHTKEVQTDAYCESLC